ncbi:ankyrin repeat domain-containing protein, partial [Gemmatimonadota bacterium]
TLPSSRAISLVSPSPRGMTPLMAAAMNGRAEAVSALLEFGSDPSLTDGGGDTALSWATLNALGSGDDAILSQLSGSSSEGEAAMSLLRNGIDMDGTFQPGFQSLREEEEVYAPGGFAGPCLSRRNPAMDPAHPSPGQAGSGAFRETHVWFEGGMSVGTITPPNCEPLHLAPAQYRVQVLGGDVSWVWECAYPRGDGCIIVRKNATTINVMYEFDVGVEANAPLVPNPDEPCEVESIEITLPTREKQYAYDGSPQGLLEVAATARALPTSCGKPIQWSMEDIGEVSARQQGAGESVEFRFTGLPRESEAFGPKVIRAEVDGVSVEVVVEVFFDPTAWNNPGEGALPNWFHYWGQTRAGGGQTVHYSPERRSRTTGGFAQAQYDYTKDRVYLTDITYSKSCAPRTSDFGGGSSKGIDCFAELVRHENQHKVDRHAWWGARNPETAPWADDWDQDLVPNEVEERLSETRGCNAMWRESCSGVPAGSIDVEMDAYATGWGWIRGGANDQDWSWCGKQWKDPSVCQGSKIW